MSGAFGLQGAELAAYRALGHAGPYPLLSGDEVEDALRAHADTYRSVPWYKSLHVYETALVDAARRPEVVDRVASILGEDLILWATQVMTKPPGQNHRWHVDVETLAWTSVNVWVALRNVTLQSTIQLVPTSHTWGVPVQDLERSSGVDLGSSSAVLQAARSIDPEASVISVDLAPGEFVVFDGHVWHGSENTTATTRSALLLQYSPSDAIVRRPASFEDPVRWHDDPPACVLVRGRDLSGGANLLVEPVQPPRPGLAVRVIDRVKGRR